MNEYELTKLLNDWLTEHRFNPNRLNRTAIGRALSKTMRALGWRPPKGGSRLGGQRGREMAFYLKEVRENGYKGPPPYWSGVRTYEELMEKRRKEGKR